MTATATATITHDEINAAPFCRIVEQVPGLRRRVFENVSHALTVAEAAAADFRFRDATPTTALLVMVSADGRPARYALTDLAYCTIDAVSLVPFADPAPATTLF